MRVTGPICDLIGPLLHASAVPASAGLSSEERDLCRARLYVCRWNAAQYEAAGGELGQSHAAWFRSRAAFWESVLEANHAGQP
jgi:hypothetical protein